MLDRHVLCQTDIDRFNHGCQVGVEIPAHRPPKTSPKIAQLTVPSEFTVTSELYYISSSSMNS